MPDTTSSIYVAFMEEAKLRIEEVGFRLNVLKSDPTSKTAFFEVEFAYLQIRYVCELIALGALAAHHSMGLPSQLLTAFNAEAIFAKLEHINEHCFPVAVTQERGSDDIVQFQPAGGKQMTRKDLKAIYSECGEVLHRGAIKHALAGKRKAYDPGMVATWRQQIVDLLWQHVIFVPSENLVFLVHLTGGPDGSVQVSKAVSDGPYAFAKA